MSGIFCSIWRNMEEDKTGYELCKPVIQKRGPDHVSQKVVKLSSRWSGRFVVSILWTQGTRPVAHVRKDSSSNVLAWNGDIYSGCSVGNKRSDIASVSEALEKSGDVVGTLAAIRGPFSFVYYDAAKRRLYFGRDFLGKHSLLMSASPKYDKLIVVSAATRKLVGAVEVPAVGVFVFDLKSSTIDVHPWRAPGPSFYKSIDYLQVRLGLRLGVVEQTSQKRRGIPASSSVQPRPDDIECFANIGYYVANAWNTKNEINCEVMRSEVVELIMKSLLERSDINERVVRVLGLLKNSMKLRVTTKPECCNNCIQEVLKHEKIICSHAKLGIAFSGGLDSTILAVLADELAPPDESIDLINVAFENTREHDTAVLGKNFINWSSNYNIPDRKIGREALAELQKICPRRKWNFVECNVQRPQVQKCESSRISDLVYPQPTVHDVTLGCCVHGCALWFASRGSGILSSTGKLYKSPCRVLVLGTGADELFGGYMSHRTTLKCGGWPALSEELDEGISRISEEHLGRDDRVISDHGRQSRLPYLDEDLIEYVSSLNAWERCYPTENMPLGLGDKLLLRLVARKLGLRKTANLPQRSIQISQHL